MTVQFDFVTQLTIGAKHERRLDEHFRQFDVEILPAMPEQQRQGIDRVFRHRSTGEVTTMEYKADERAAETGNAFIETVSVDTTGKPGWAASSQAEYLVYLVVGPPECIYLIPMVRLRAQLARWERSCRKAQARNEGYSTHGLLVPLRELEAIAVAVW
jgi:hypothetical protein